MDRIEQRSTSTEPMYWGNTAEDILDSLPPELSVRWRERMQNEGVTPGSAEAFVRSMLAEREKVRIPRFRSDRLRVLDRVPVGLVGKLERVDEHAVELDRGHWGRVMRCRVDDIEIKAGAPSGGRVLYKVLLGPPVGYHNDLQAEAGFLTELHALSEKRPELRVGVPAPYFFVSDPRREILAMEDVSHAVSIKNIMERGISIPPEFPLEDAFEAVRQFIDYMHEEGYYHRDLREGNIMLNLSARAGGSEPLAYVIDPGFCIRTFSEEVARKGMDKTPDNGMINIVEKSLKTHLKNRETEV